MRRLIASLSLAIFAAAVPAARAADDHGHDHGDAAPSAATNGPSRQPDGSVFLPKPAQRQLTVRTVAVKEAELPRTVALSARIVMDPNAGGKVQATQSGRLMPGPHGLKSVGEAVRQGDVLATVVASSSAVERANQSAQLAELRAARTLAEKRLARLRELSDTVPRKDIEAAESDVASLAARAAAIGAGLSGRETLVAPVSGVIATAHAVAGQVVDARDLVYEVVDPSRLQVEALAFDPGLATDVGSASLAVGRARVPLQFVGASRALREQALPLTFRARQAALAGLAIGQPVTVFVQTRQTVKGVAVPAASVLRNPGNQAIVWVKTAPERFEPRVVTTEPLDGVAVAVTSGLRTGDRVATQGAALVNQIR